MFSILGLTTSRFQGIAPIVARALPMPVAMAKIGKALREVCRWSEPVDVYDPKTDFSRIDWKTAIQKSPEEAPKWSEDEQESLIDSLVAPLKTDSLFEDFAQTNTGNCAMVATLKAAMRKFGKGLFYSVKISKDDDFCVRLRDGNTVYLRRQDLALTREAAKLKGDQSPTKSFALLAYAVAAARRAQLLPAVDLERGFVDGWLTDHERFERALDDISNGHRPEHCATYLGVGNEMRTRRMSPEEDPADDSTVVSSFGHSVFVQRVDGEMKADHYGNAVEYDGTDTNGKKSREKLTFEGKGLQDVDGWFYI